MTSLALYDVSDDVRSALLADCPTCHGEPWLDAVNGEPCPDCGSDPATVLTRALDAIAPAADTPPDIYREQVKMLALKLGMSLKELVVEVETLEAHQAAIAHRIRVRQNRIASVKAWAQLNMEGAGLTKIKNEYVTVYLSDSREAIEIEDLEAVPKAYKRATLKMPLAVAHALQHIIELANPPEGTEPLLNYIVGVDCLKTQFMEMNHTDDGVICDEDSVVIDGVRFLPKGHKRSLVVRS